MSKRLNELAEIVLDRVYTYGYQQRAAEAEQCRADDDLLAVERKLAEVTAERDKLAAEIETLQQEVAAGDKALQILAKDRDHWRESRQQAIEAGELMQAEIETLREKLERSQQQASDFVQTIDENNDRLTEAEARIWPGKTFGDDALAKMVSEILNLRAQLAGARREASEEFVERQVLQAESSLDYRELELLRAEAVKLRTLNDALLEINTRLRAQLAASGDSRELERLREFVDSVRTAYANYEWPGFYERIKDAFAALDTATPAPVTEPMDVEGGE